jgi:hypothetical protein
MRCRHCGVELAAGAIFCQRCGKPVESGEFSPYEYDTDEQLPPFSPVLPAASPLPQLPPTPAGQPIISDQQQPVQSAQFAEPAQSTQEDQPQQQTQPAPPGYPGQPGGFGSAVQSYLPQQAISGPQNYQGPFPQAPVVAPKRTGVSPTMLVLLIVLALFIGGGGVFAFYSFSHRSSSSQPTTSSQTPAPPSPTRTTVTITATDPIQLYTQATSGQPTLVDPLNSSNPNGWQAVSSGGKCTFAGNTLKLSAQAARSGQSAVGICVALATNFSDFAYQVDTTIAQGDIAGVTFRTDPFAGAVYQFGIDNTGGYILYTLVTNVAGKTTLKILTEGVNSAIKTGANQLNVLTVIARGSVINLYANSQYLTTVTDSTVSGGEIGLFGENTQGGTVNVSYNSIKVWQL